LFNLEKFDLKLDTERIGRNFVYAEEVTSTNVVVLKQRNIYKQHGSLLLAENQTNGKGRKNRPWYSAKDMNLTFSVLVSDPKYLRKKVNLLNFVASLAVVLSIENFFQLRTELKWPNDVIIRGKKVAGVLLESITHGSRIERLVIGIGLNVNQTVFQGKFTLDPTSLKKELGLNVEREKILAEILNNLEELMETSLSDSNEVMNEWRERCRMIGGRITVSDDENVKSGIFEDIDDMGFLVLRSNDKVETIHFGDVSII